MTRYAVGDVQGCQEELRTLLERLEFSSDRDQLWLVGDLVNRGPRSLDVLRFVRDLGGNAVTVLGNHDLHLLAVAHGARRVRGSDTIDAVLSAPDRDRLLEWLITRPLAHAQPAVGERRMDLMVHAGVVPQWSVETTLHMAREVETALREDPRELFDHMYADDPDRWSPALTGTSRIRFAINVLTRLRVCTEDGRIDLTMKGKPTAGTAMRPWFDIDSRLSRDARIVFGHWSALGFIRRPGLIGLDSGCVWGGALTAVDLDAEGPPVSVPCSGYQQAD